MTLSCWQGFVRLTGPDRGIEANDDVSLIPILIHIAYAAFDRQPRHNIWRADMEGKVSLYDQLMVHRWESIFGAMELNYAIYEDGAEAHIDVTFIDWEGENIEVYGTVGVRNSKITDPKARSLLFDSNSEEAISVHPGKVTHLPLSRQITVLPLGSVLIVDVSLLHCSTILAEESVSFIARSTGDEELILVCHLGKIKVKVIWLNEKVHKEAGEN